MDGQNYVVFHAGTDNSYMNSTANFRGADVGTTFVDLYFLGSTGATDTVTGYDKVRLTATAAKEELALEDVGAALAGAKNPVVVIADDINSLYVSDHVTAVASITLSATGTFKSVETMTSNTNLAKSDSGKRIMLNAAAGLSAVKLPTVAAAGAGWHIDFIVGTVTTSNNYVITEDTATDTNVIISMAVELADTTGPIDAGHTTITFQSTPTKGDRLNIVCDGTNFYAMAVTQDDAGVAFA